MKGRALLLAGIALGLLSPPALAQTAKDYARYNTCTAPKPQGQKVGGLRVFMLSGLKSHGPGRA